MSVLVTSMLVGISIIAIIILTTRLKLKAFIALFIVSLFLAFSTLPVNTMTIIWNNQLLTSTNIKTKSILIREIEQIANKQINNDFELLNTLLSFRYTSNTTLDSIAKSAGVSFNDFLI